MQKTPDVMKNICQYTKKIAEGIFWRYNCYILPHLPIDKNFISFFLRKLRNFFLKYSSTPICYISADAINIGDRLSAKGVRYLVGLQGIELFASPDAIKSTSRVLKWLKKNRPKTKIIIGGGGLFQECFVPFWEMLISTNLKFAIFGVGANEMGCKRKLPPEKLLHDIAQRALGVHVRDQWTHDLLQFGQVNTFTIGVCPSVNYLVSRFPKNERQRKRYLLHIKHPADVQMSKGDLNRITEVIKNVAKELDLLYDEATHIKENLPKLIRRYHRAHFVISSRLHGCIFSYSFGIPFIPIATDKKTEAFVKTHTPGNPVSNVSITKDDILSKLFKAIDVNNETKNLNSAIINNEIAMQRLLSRFK